MKLLGPRQLCGKDDPRQPLPLEVQREALQYRLEDRFMKAK